MNMQVFAAVVVRAGQQEGSEERGGGRGRGGDKEREEGRGRKGEACRASVTSCCLCHAVKCCVDIHSGRGVMYVRPALSGTGGR